MKRLSSPLLWLQDWFHDQCDGEWEHSHELTIKTLDNPGWRIAIDIRETSAAKISFERIVIERNDRDWLQIWVEKGCIHSASGTANLEEALSMIREKICGCVDLSQQ